MIRILESGLKKAKFGIWHLAYGIEKDWEAVQAAIDIPFSNGLLRGQ